MASLFKRADSPYWWIKHVDKNGKRKASSTGYLRNDPTQTKLARRLEAQLAADEHAHAVQSDNHRWESWVPKTLERHCAQPRTLQRYLGAWGWISMYLRERRIFVPAELDYAGVLGYLEWRVAYKKRAGRSVGLNTALLDTRVLRIVMRHAVRLGYAATNPCDRLGVAKAQVKEKPELTDQDIADIWKALQADDIPEWMRRAFQISLHTGCRLSETAIDMRNIDLQRGVMTFATPKGGAIKAFTVGIPDALMPLLTKIKANREPRTLEIPRMPGKAWWDFFKNRMKRRDLCFHTLRVTFVTRLARAEVLRSIAMRMVNHSSSLVHSVYQRLGVEDVKAWSNKVQLPALDSPGATPSPL